MCPNNKESDFYIIAMLFVVLGIVLGLVISNAMQQKKLETLIIESCAPTAELNQDS